MPKVDLYQDSTQWLDWRKDKITASDVAKVLNRSPYGTSYSLWQEKTKRVPPVAFNDNMRFGQRMEPFIREYWSMTSDNAFSPACYEHPTIPYLAASLDGVTFEEDRILEIKTCNKEVFEQAKEGIVVDHYYIQIQVQLMCVPSALFCDAVFANGLVNDVKSEHIAHNKVFPDEELQKLIKVECAKFKKLWETDTPPEYTDKDYVFVGDDWNYSKAEREWLTAQESVKYAKGIEEEARKKMIMLAGERNARGNHVKISKIKRSGSIDYKSLVESRGIDETELEKYRKPSTEYFKPMIIK